MSASIEKQRQSIELQKQSAKQMAPPPSPRRTTAFAPPACDPLPKEEAEALIEQAAKREDLQPDLLRAVISQESGYRPCAVSSKGAMGLMQLMPATFTEVGEGDPFNPRQNIDSGARYLKQLLTRYGGDVKLALGAYNAGPARVDATGDVPAIAETLNYVQAVMGRLPH